MKHNFKKIILSRTDSLGDVVLTLPVAKFLKDFFPEVTVIFLGKAYSKPLIEACKYVDEFIDVKEFLSTKKLRGEIKDYSILHVFPMSEIALKAKQLHIPLRIGTVSRIYHWFACNKLVKLSRKNSELHEAQLNLKLLEAFDIRRAFTLQEIGHSFGLEKLQPFEPGFQQLLIPNKFNLIIHPKSQGNGREWPIEHYIALIRALDIEQYQIFISGTQNEQSSLQPILDVVGERVTDISGKMNLDQFVSFINACDGIVASGTGPLHIAAALDKYAFGIFPPMKPIHPGRWGPVGRKAKAFTLQKNCSECRHNPLNCHCVNEVQPSWIKHALGNAVTEVNK